jgi:hypothetical protein
MQQDPFVFKFKKIFNFHYLEIENKKTLEKEEENPRLITPRVMDSLRAKLEEIRIDLLDTDGTLSFIESNRRAVSELFNEKKIDEKQAESLVITFNLSN